MATPREQLSDWSERRDSNSRPLAPEASALPGCATLRPTVPGGQARRRLEMPLGDRLIAAAAAARKASRPAVGAPVWLP